MNNVAKFFANSTVSVSKKLLNKRPELKSKIKRFINANVNNNTAFNDSYMKWFISNYPDGIDIVDEKKHIASFDSNPLISIIVPIYDTPEQFFKEMIKSVQAQTYTNWELILVDDASPKKETRNLILYYANLDGRIKYKFLKKNHHISGATNEGIKIANGLFISLLDHDDILWPNALYEVVKALNTNDNLNFLYTDEDKIDGNDRHIHYDPFFKPDWNPVFLRSANYITHFTTIRKTTLDKFGYEVSDYNGSQDWELFLRITRNIESDTIYHIHKIVYSWRVHKNSTASSIGAKPYVVEAQKKTLESDLKARNINGSLIYDRKNTRWLINYVIDNSPLVSIIIFAKHSYKYTKRYIDLLIKNTDYRNYEIIVVGNGKYSFKNKIAKYINDSNTSNTYKDCVDNSNGKFVVFIDESLEITSKNWLNNMLMFAQQENTGFVGGKILAWNGKSIYQAGIGINLQNKIRYLFHDFKLNMPITTTQSLMLNYVRNVTAITGCVMINKNTCKKSLGSKANYKTSVGLIDLCMKSYDKGFLNIYVPNVVFKMKKGESLYINKKYIEELKKARAEFLIDDPNVNLNTSNSSFEILN